MQTTLLTSRAAEWESATFADKAEVGESSGALEALRATPGRGSQDGRRVREDELTLDEDEDKGCDKEISRVGPDCCQRIWRVPAYP